MKVFNRANTSDLFFDMIEKIVSEYVSSMATGEFSNITFDLTRNATVEFWECTSDHDHLRIIMVFPTLADAADRFRAMKKMSEEDFLTMYRAQMEAPITSVV